MNLDIRYPIGFLFLVVGAILAAYGLVSGPRDLRQPTPSA